MNEALRFMDESANNVISFGDSLKDYQAATTANIEHFACSWETQEDIVLRENECENFINHPQQVVEIQKKLSYFG